MNERPFDPGGPLPWRSLLWPFAISDRAQAERYDPAAWTEHWLDSTKWWGDVVAEGSRRWPDARKTILVEVAEGLGRRFRGRRFRVGIADREGQCTLRGLWLEPDADVSAMRVRLDDVLWDGMSCEHVSIDVATVSLTSPPDLAVQFGGIEVVANTAISQLVAWLNSRIGAWELRVEDDQRIIATRSGGAVSYEIDAVVIEDQVRLELRGVHRRRLDVRLPGWLRLTRSFPLPPSPGGARLVDARRRGSGVELRIAVPDLRRRIDLERVRDLVSRGALVDDGGARGDRESAGAEVTVEVLRDSDGPLV
jgi:hypothetical protein